MNNGNYKFLTSIFLLLVPLFSSIAQDSINIQRHLKYLSSDLFEGRGTGTIGGELAAKYIAINLNQNELTPMGYENTFYQYVPMHGSTPDKSSKIIIVGESNDTLKIEADFNFYHSGGRVFAPNSLELVFVGYGITAPEYNYDNYSDVNAEGKVVVYIDGEPKSGNENYFKGDNLTNHSFPDTKQKVALANGAVGTIQVSTKCNTEEDWTRLGQEFHFEDITLAYLPTPLLSIIMKPDAVRKIFKNAEHNYDSVVNMCRLNELKSFNLKSRILFEPSFKRRDFISPNVVGFIEGSDKKMKDNHIVVSAHYDHLGIGLPVMGDSIYNGLLDNAIGVSALLELSSMLSKNRSNIKSSIIFLFVTGEEKGMLGSSYFIDHPPIPKEKIIANINIDGLAVLDKFNSIIGIGAEYSDLRNVLEITAKESGLKVAELSDRFDYFESFLRSDQLAFALAGIPSILISDGLDYENITREKAIQKWKEYMEQRYHTPFDDLSQTINYRAVSQHINFLYDFILKTADYPDEIKWKPNSPFQRDEIN